MLTQKLDEYTRKMICERLEISRRTLYNWEHEIGITNIVKFIELLDILGIDPLEYMQTYNQKNSTPL